MLSREHGIAVYDYSARRVFPDRLLQSHHANYRNYAVQMLSVYANGIGKTRQELHREIEAVLAEEPACPTQRIASFCKLLDESSMYDADSRGAAAKLRSRVFSLAAKHHPLLRSPELLYESAEATVKSQIASELGESWASIDARLFADVVEFQRLTHFVPPEPAALLANYNVGQIQVVLYSAIDVIIRAQRDFKQILRHAKLARLMHTISRVDDGYEIHLDGPSSQLRQTRRYGAAFAKFLPAILACSDWELRARIQIGHGHAWLDYLLTSRDGYRGLAPVVGFDSSVEQHFAETWGAEPRAGWTLSHESVILHAGQRVFIPDFVLRHADGREVLLEIVGFWTPEYLAAKAGTLDMFRQHDILLAVAEAHLDQMPALARPCIPFRKVLKPKAVVEALQANSNPAP